VTPSLGWLMRNVSLAYIACRHRKKRPCTLRLTNICHGTTLHMVQYQTFFWSPWSNNRMVFFSSFVLSKSTIWRVG
jgi:hypothetical protein